MTRKGAKGRRNRQHHKTLRDSGGNPIVDPRDEQPERFAAVERDKKERQELEKLLRKRNNAQ